MKRVFVGLAILAGCQAADPDRFDLICTSQSRWVSPTENRVTENQEARLSLNLKAMTWCSKVLKSDSPSLVADGCDKGRIIDIKSVTGSEIVLLRQSNLFLSIGRGDGVMTGQMSNRADSSGRYVTQGSCRKAPYTGPKTKF